MPVTPGRIRHPSSRTARHVVWAAVLANLVIAVAKFYGHHHTDSIAMFSEGIHSLVDAGNGSLLLVGMRLSRRPADETHPFGYGKELYFWSLIVALLVFALGGGASVAEGILRVASPLPIANPSWNFTILGLAALFEGSSLLFALHAFRPSQGKLPLWTAIHRSKDPSAFTVIFEDSAALLGLLFAFVGLLLQHVAGWAAADGAASIAIGLLLMMVAYLLMSESKALLVGEGADRQTLRLIRGLALSDPAVERAGYPMTMYFGPQNVLLTMDIQFAPRLSGAAIERAVDRVEAAIREAFPEVRYIYLEVQAIRAGSRGEDMPFPEPPEEAPAEGDETGESR